MTRPYRLTEKQRVGKPIQRAIEKRNETHAHQVWLTKLVGGPFQERGLPDYFCVYRGWAIFWETKRLPGQRGTALQEYTMRKLRESGAVAFVPDTAEAALRVLDQIDDFEDRDGPMPKLKQ